MPVPNLVSRPKWVLVNRICNSSMNRDFLLHLSGVESAHEHAQGRRGVCLFIIVPEWMIPPPPPP